MQAHYSPAYAYLWDDAGAWYVATMYNKEKLTEEFQDPRAKFYKIADENEAYGFCKTIAGKAPTGADESLRYFYFQRIYLATNAQGKGIGTRVMEEETATARAEKYARIWLEAMEVGKAKTFYERLGYYATGKIRLPFLGMKDDLRGLVTMELEL
jgi:GNAT superfamily N-acetyltransferase